MKKWLCLLLAGILLLSLNACKNEPASPKDFLASGSSSALYNFSNVDVNINYTADKSAFSNPISCTYGEETITVNAPRFTGIPVNSVYYQQNYRFSESGVTLNVCTDTGGRTFLVDKNGRILSDDYMPVINNSQSIMPSDIGAQYAAGNGMYVYTDGTMTANGEILYGLKNSTGSVITKAQYLGYHINFYDGYAVVEKTDGTYVAIDTNGKEYGTLPEGSSNGCETVVVQTGVPGTYLQFLYDIHGNRLSDGYDAISCFFDGLALIKKDNKIGIIDSHGKVILAPTIDYDIVTYPPKDRGFSVDFLDENAFLLPIGGEFAIITIDK